MAVSGPICLSCGSLASGPVCPQVTPQGWDPVDAGTGGPSWGSPSWGGPSWGSLATSLPVSDSSPHSAPWAVPKRRLYRWGLPAPGPGRGSVRSWGSDSHPHSSHPTCLCRHPLGWPHPVTSGSRSTREWPCAVYPKARSSMVATPSHWGASWWGARAWNGGRVPPPRVPARARRRGAAWIQLRVLCAWSVLAFPARGFRIPAPAAARSGKSRGRKSGGNPRRLASRER